MNGLDGTINFTTTEYRRCEVDGKKALFHRWCDHYGVVEASPVLGGTPAGQIKYTMGIVELENGKVKEVTPSRILFLDGLVNKTFEEEV